MINATKLRFLWKIVLCCLLEKYYFTSQYDFIVTASPSIKNAKPPGYTKFVQSMLEQQTDQHLAQEMEFIQSDRNLDEITNLYDDKTQKIRLHFETSPIEKTIASITDESLKAKGNEVVDKVLPFIANEFQGAISIQPYAGIMISDTICFGLFTEYFDTNKKSYPDIDVVILVSAFDTINGEQWCSSDPEEVSALAAAAPCTLSSYNERPIVGLINVCLNAIQGLQRMEDVNDVMSHEILHVLILNSELFKYYRNGVDGTPLTTRNWRGKFNAGTVQCVDGQYRPGYPTCKNTIAVREEEVSMNGNTEKRPYYEITLPTVRQVVRNQFNCQSLTGARLENQPTNPNDCTGSHFDERFFFSNVMSAMYIYGSAHFSPLLLALMEDSGWYKANYEIAENGSFGLNAGCDFVKKDCIVDGNVPEFSEGYFCNDLYGSTSPYRCGPTHTYRGKCDLFEMLQYEGRTYFDSTMTGPRSFSLADWCPMISLAKDFCDDNSKCLDFTFNSQRSAACIESFCSYEMEQFVFKIGNSFYTCNPGDRGRIIEIEHGGRLYKFTCPNLAQICPDMFCPAMCSGKGICNWNGDPKPICECFDPNDNTAGCFDSGISQPGDCNDSGVKTNLSVMPSENPSIHPTHPPSAIESLQPSEDPTHEPSISLVPSSSTMPSFDPTSTFLPTSIKRFDDMPSSKIVTLSLGTSKGYSYFIVGASIAYTLQVIFI